MAKTLGEAKVNIRANLKPLQDGLKKAFTMVTDAMRKIGRAGLRLAKWAALGFTGISIAAVKMAADAQESENLFEVSMGKIAATTRKWSEITAKAFGVSAYAIRRYVSTFNVMLGSMGLDEGAAAEMSKQLTQLAYDMASFYNLKPDEAFQKIQAGITGEIEPLKRLGIIVNETTTKNWALTNGLVKQGEALSEQMKVYARFRLIMEQTGKSQGDLVRTAGSLTNVWRSLVSTIKNLAIEYGTLLIPMVTRGLITLRDFLRDNEDRWLSWAEKVIGRVKVTVAVLSGLVKFIRTDMHSAIKSGIENLLTIFEAFAKSVGLIMKDAGLGVAEGLLEGLQKASRFVIKWGLGGAVGEALLKALPPVDYDFSKYREGTSGKIAAIMEKVGAKMFDAWDPRMQELFTRAGNAIAAGDAAVDARRASKAGAGAGAYGGYGAAPGAPGGAAGGPGKLPAMLTPAFSINSAQSAWTNIMNALGKGTQDLAKKQLDEAKRQTDYLRQMTTLQQTYLPTVGGLAP